MADYRRLLTLDQVADLCGVTPRTVWAWTTRGLRCLRIGRRLRVSPEDLDAWIAGCSASRRVLRETPPSGAGRKRSAAKAKRELARKGAI